MSVKTPIYYPCDIVYCKYYIQSAKSSIEEYIQDSNKGIKISPTNAP